MREHSALRSAGPARSGFRVLPVDLTEQNGYRPPTLKINRALIHKDVAAEIEELYR